MTGSTTRPTRSEIVRKRRAQVSRQRFQAAAQAATASVRSLVSRPRKVTGRPGDPSTGSGGRHRRRFEIALPGRRRSPSGGGLALHAPTALRLHVSWRLASFSLVILLVAMLARLLTDPRLFVDGINLGGASLVPDEEIFAESGLARQHIFWVDPAEAQKRIEAIPGIAAAQVSVKWPNLVTVVVQERVPMVMWLEGEQQWWVDAQGLKFKSRGDLPGLLPIAVDDAPVDREAPLQGTGAIPNPDKSAPVEAVRGALQLKQLRSNIELLHYDSLRGLSYQDGRNWRGYFGVGAEGMEQKLVVYETLVDSLLARGIHPTMISVENPLAAYYRK